MIGAEETVRVRYRHDKPQVESERRPGRARKSGEGPRETTSRYGVGKRLSKSKREERQRRQRGIRLRRIFYLFAIALILGAAARGLYVFSRGPAFSLDNVIVDGASHHTDQSIAEIGGLDRPGLTLLQISSRDVVRRLERDPWIAEAKVTRRLPHTIDVEVVERRPVAVIDGGNDQLWVIAGDSHWLSKRSSEDTGLVLVRDVPQFEPVAGKRAGEVEVSNAVEVILGLSQELRSAVAMVSAPSVDETALRTAAGVEIFVGEAVDMAEKDRVIREILSQQKDSVVYINVRVVKRPTWRGLK